MFELAQAQVGDVDEVGGGPEAASRALGVLQEARSWPYAPLSIAN